MSELQDRIAGIVDRIAQAEKKSGRPQGATKLIAVSKTKSFEHIQEAYDLGLRHFGENYIQEATRKIERAKLQNLDVHWHLIGPLQTNKSKYAVGRFDTIQSVDRIDLAKILNKRAAEAQVIQKIMIQVKLGDEPTKSGVPVGALDVLLGQMQGLERLQVVGLMSLPPLDAEPEASRHYFVQLRKLKEELLKKFESQQMKFEELSMGTTFDFDIAIEEGATMIRVGTAIFGRRGEAR
ncbi:MAG: YggS family pyridoxal phosphate-dependent enzyme [Oligoflexia bacterium]|nr:YggS family pyridoxal phosphate-dependent enzyme [Oligoflexia bacterium]